MKKENLDFDGMAGDGVNRAANRFAGNHMNSAMKENYGMGPRRGNASSAADDVGPSATRDKHKLTIATASQGGRINGGATVKQWPNADKINVG